LSSNSLIDQYVDYATSACDAPRIFHLAMSYFIASSLVGRFANIVTTYRPKGIKPNLWVILVGPSRIVRKTTSLDLAEDIIREIDEDIIIPASFSPEGLYDILSNMHKGDVGAWIKDELGGFFKSLQSKRYMAGTRELLSMIYMGRGEERKLRTYHVRIPWGIYVTCAGTVPTPASYYFSEEDFTSGFLNRFILAYALTRDKRIPILHTDPEVNKKRTKIIKSYRELVDECIKQAPIIISFNSKAIKGLEDYDTMVEMEMARMEKSKLSPLWKNYLAESPNQLLKFCVLRRLTRGNIKTSIVVVDEDDYVKAYNDLRLFLKCAREIIDEVQVSARPKKVETEERRLLRVVEIIRSKESKGIKWTELLMRTYLLKQDLLKIIETLMDQERIVAVRTNPIRGRKAILFLDKDYALTSNDYHTGKLLSVDEVKAILT